MVVRVVAFSLVLIMKHQTIRKYQSVFKSRKRSANCLDTFKIYLGRSNKYLRPFIHLGRASISHYRLCPDVRIICSMVRLLNDMSNFGLVQEEPAFLRRMREGFTRDDDKKEEKRRRRGSEEVIDQDEAPQVVIEDKFKDKIAEDEARAYVVEKEGVKIDNPVSGSTKANISAKPKAENVSLGMKKAKKLNEGMKRTVEDDKDGTKSEKSRKSAPRKEKKLKLSFEDD